MQTPDGQSSTLLELEFAHTLYSEHLGESLDALVRAVRHSRMSEGQKPRERRFAIASVVHGYSALEAIANMLKFEVYDYKGGRFFRPVDNGDIALKRLLHDWPKVPIEQRCDFLLHTQEAGLDDALRMHIGEVRELRHLLAHGYVMPGVMVFERGGGAMEYEVKHPKEDRFPRLKFSPPDKLIWTDARAALEVVLRAAHALSRSTGHVLSFVSYELDPAGIRLLFGGGAHDDAPVQAILERIDQV
jgi:hypothetical protein